MPFSSTEVLLLDSANFFERDRIITFLTSERGKLRGVARGARHKFSRFAGRLQPLSKLQVSWFEKENSDLVRISDAELLRSSQPILEDLEGILLAAYLGEHLVEFAQENEPSPRLFRLLDSTVEALCGGLDRNLAARYVEVWVLRLSGIFPEPVNCPQCDRPLVGGAVLPARGEMLVCRQCAGAGGGLRVSREALAVLARMGRESVTKMAGNPPSRDTLATIEAVCGGVRRAFLNHELKSYRVMQETLEGLTP